MSTKLFLQLRLPVTCLPPGMKLCPRLPLSSTSNAAAFSRLFPFRLKYQCMGPHRRRFSTRSDRSRSDFSAARASKSLVDDEAELSAWVSERSSDSPGGKGGRRFAEEAGSDDDFGPRKVKARGSRDSFSGKRVRYSESDSEDSDEPSRPRMSRGSSVRSDSPTNRDTRKPFTRNARFQEEGNSSRNREFEPRNRNSKPNSFSRNPQQYDAKRREGNGDFTTRKSSPRFQDQRLGSSSSMRKRGPSGRDMESGYRKFGADSRKEEALFSEGGDDDEDEDDIEAMNKLDIGDLISDDESDSDEEDEDSVIVPKERAKGSERLSAGDSESYLSETRFDECSVSPLSLKGIKDAGYEKMTVVQEATLPVILKGKDVLAKAKTGTGKTVAFLLPSIEVVVNSSSIGRDQKRPPILVLVICPTRELACQAAAEANTLLKYHPSIGVQVVIGGTRLALEQKRMQANPCQILVATPGRLRDHMENTAGFSTRLTGVKVLVLDEADHLLDMGFRKDIERIIAAVPKQRQTLLFSATVPEEVRQVCHIALKRDYEFINTVKGGSEDTHSQVKQLYLVAPLERQFSILYTLLKEHIANDVEYKVIVFCTTAMLTKLVAELLAELKMNVREIHSRKSQSYRTKVSDEFRKSKGIILATSDVSARGVDYPDVTLVIQIGLPADKQQYIHRLGRTGRKGKEGEGILLLTPWEEFFLSSVKDLPISKATMPSVDPDTRRKVELGLSNVEMKSKESAYQAWLGYYNSNKTVGRDKIKLVELANEFSRSMGLDSPPAIPKLVLGKMGLKNVPGLRVK